MNKDNFDRAVFSGQVIIASYDIKSDWWHKVNIWAWNRFGMAHCLDEIAIIITPFHIVFGRIPRTTDIAKLKTDWRLIMGLVEKTYRTPVVAAETQTWAYMYRLLPCTVEGLDQIAQSRSQLRHSLQFLNGLSNDSVYHNRFRQFPYYVPPVGRPLPGKEFAIRVGRFGQAGQYDRLRVEITDVAGRRVIQD